MSSCGEALLPERLPIGAACATVEILRAKQARHLERARLAFAIFYFGLICALHMPYEGGIPAPAVLIVDDDAEIVYLVRLFLERAGYQVSIANNGRDAVAVLAGSPPALILLDVLMPFQDGFNLLSRIRATPAWSTVPIIMLTALAQEGDIVRALDAGANDYIVKPFQPDELLARVRRYVKVNS